MQTLGFRDGEYTIDFTGDFGPEVMTLPLKTERLIMDGMTSIQHWSLIQRGLGDLDRMLKQSSRADLDVAEEPKALPRRVFSQMRETDLIFAMIGQHRRGQVPRALGDARIRSTSIASSLWLSSDRLRRSRRARNHTATAAGVRGSRGVGEVDTTLNLVKLDQLSS